MTKRGAVMKAWSQASSSAGARPSNTPCPINWIKTKYFENEYVLMFHLNNPHDHIKGEEGLPQWIALDRSIGSGQIWNKSLCLEWSECLDSHQKLRGVGGAPGWRLETRPRDPSWHRWPRRWRWPGGWGWWGCRPPEEPDIKGDQSSSLVLILSRLFPRRLTLPCLECPGRRPVAAWSASDTSRTTLGVKSVHFDDYQMIAMWTLTEIPDADQMDEDIHGLVVIWGVKYKLLPKIKKSSLTHFNSVFWLK